MNLRREGLGPAAMAEPLLGIEDVITRFGADCGGWRITTDTRIRDGSCWLFLTFGMEPAFARQLAACLRELGRANEPIADDLERSALYATMLGRRP